MKYAEFLKKYTHTGDGTFYDAIRIVLLKNRRVSIKIWYYGVKQVKKAPSKHHKIEFLFYNPINLFLSVIELTEL